MNLLDTLSFITSHPLTRDRPLGAIGRFIRWQIGSRLHTEVEHPWIEGARLAVRNGMTGATGNIYCGLHEFVDMAFVLHCLREGDLFIDVGANVGSYSVLAAFVSRSDVIAIEPDPCAIEALGRNIALNGLSSRVQVVAAALGPHGGSTRLTIGLDTMNRVSNVRDAKTREVPMKTLDEVVGERRPVVMKLDVEGFEGQVLSGGRETLSKSSLIAIETECRDDQVRGLMREFGFVEAFYDPFARALVGEAAYPHSNGLFVRDKHACTERMRTARRVRVLGHAL